MGTQLASPQKGAEPPPHLSAHVHCGQTAGWIKTTLGTEVGLGPRHTVLDGDPSPLKGHSPPIVGQCPLWPNGWMDQDATWYGGKPRPRQRCVRWGRSSPSINRAQLPVFSLCLLWQNGWMDEGAIWYGSRPWPRPHC